MKEKTLEILLAVLAILLAVSIFLNGWLLHERLTAHARPENDMNVNPDLTTGIIETYSDYAEDFDTAVNNMINDAQGGGSPPNNTFICEGECGSKHPHS